MTYEHNPIPPDTEMRNGASVPDLMTKLTNAIAAKEAATGKPARKKRAPAKKEGVKA